MTTRSLTDICHFIVKNSQISLNPHILIEESTRCCILDGLGAGIDLAAPLRAKIEADCLRGLSEGINYTAENLSLDIKDSEVIVGNKY